MEDTSSPSDPLDHRILAELQRNGRISNAVLAERTHTSTSVCWRRTRQLEQKGVISGYHARIEPKSIGLDVLAYVSVRIDRHTDRDFDTAAGSCTLIMARSMDTQSH